MVTRDDGAVDEQLTSGRSPARQDIDGGEGRHGEAMLVDEKTLLRARRVDVMSLAWSKYN